MEISSTKLCKKNLDSLHVSESLVRLHWQLSGSPLSTRVQNSKRRNFFSYRVFCCVPEMGRRTDLLEMLMQFGPFHSTSFYVQYLIKSSNNNLSNFKVILFVVVVVKSLFR
jgi:hypothetical protein